MGKADKHQRSAEKERLGSVKNPHSGEALQLPLLPPAPSNRSASLTERKQHTLSELMWIIYGTVVPIKCSKKAIKVGLSCRTNQLALGLAHRGFTCVRILLRITEGKHGEAWQI